ncbi:hypothetical protein SmJEL517_g05157 [Synchytrium microbalum]|uniref:[histone H3]-trimethyl-L-lysine(4) demethylase n=1 Tax=Synchytrium microbalum TaxID=1806994 RepID=A0A507C1X5_9FUNG|nr:uncharacterized protein SmJEL517_g05157 [Synchytrium microbalum]TPX31535.1 hypothetical protein SmJEL517_g05157 [Synchytrium microbalum]
MVTADPSMRGTRARKSKREASSGLDFTTLDPPFLPNPAEPRPPGPRPFGLPEAPVFHPTPEQFQNPLLYIQSIRPLAEDAGLCKIVPPASWKPDFSIDTENFFFRPRLQKLNFVEGGSRTTLNYLDQLQQYHQQNGTPLTKLPTLDRKPIDLFKLKKEVARRGGHEGVTDQKKWAEVARAIGIQGKTCTSMSHSIKTAYVKWVLPYENYLVENGKFGDEAIVTGPTTIKEEPNVPKPLLELDKNDGSKHRHATRTKLGALPSQSYLKPGEFCEICLRSENEDQILLCDVCNNGFHFYCLTPPLPAIPKGEWYCVNCLQKQGDDYGFEDGEERSLAEFQKIANEFKDNWFIGKRNHAGQVLVDEDGVEMEFWRLVESPYEEIEVEYGADLHSSHHGSGFPVIEKQPFNPYASCGWNLNNLPLLPESLFRNINSDVPGVMVPWLYVGMVFSTFCWHAEDHNTYSINYNHFGEAKTWYGVPATHADRFEEVLKKTVPELFEMNPDLLFHITTMLSPATLLRNRVPCHAIDQRAGEFIVTFPRAYHGGFNHGFNFCEAVNFATADWLSYGTQSIERYRDFRKMPVFNHEELLITTACKNNDEQTALWLKPELERLRDREIRIRNDVRTRPGKLKQVVDKAEYTNEEQGQCSYCNQYCTVTAVKCECSPERVVCPFHVDHVVCRCGRPSLIMRMKYTDDELRGLVDNVCREAYKPNQWKLKYQHLMMIERRPSLKTLQQLLAEGQRIPNIQEDLKALRDFIETAYEWQERANSILHKKKRPLRKTLAERRALFTNMDEEGVSAVSVSSSTNRSRRDKRNNNHNDPNNEENMVMEVRSLVNIQKLLKEYESLGFDAAPEVAGLKALEEEAVAYRDKARVLLAEDLPQKDYKQMIDQGRTMDIEVEELFDLQNKTRQGDWIINADILIKSPDALNDIERVVTLMDEGVEYGVKLETPVMVELRDLKEVGLQWKVDATNLLKAKSMGYDEVHELVERGKTSPVVPELLRHLQYQLQRADDFSIWLQTYGGEGQQPEGGDAQPQANIGDIRKLLKEYEDFNIRLDSYPVLQQEVRKTEEWVETTAQTMGRPAGPDVPPAPPQTLEAYLTEIRESIKACCNNVGTHDDNHTPIFCICRLPEKGIMIECDVCKEWYHISCVKVPKKVAETSEDYTCTVCDVTAPFPFGTRPTLESFRAASEEAGAFRFPPEEKDLLDIILAMVTNWKALVQDFISRPMVPGDKIRAKQYLRAAQGMPIAVDAEAHELRKKVVETSLQADSDDDKEDPNATYCMCKSHYDEERPMVQCDGCHDWFHLDCVGLSTEQADQMDKFMCPICNPHQPLKKLKTKHDSGAPKKIKLKINVPMATAADLAKNSASATVSAMVAAAASGSMPGDSKRQNMMKRNHPGDEAKNDYARPEYRERKRKQSSEPKVEPPQASHKKRRPDGNGTHSNGADPSSSTMAPPPTAVGEGQQEHGYYAPDGTYQTTADPQQVVAAMLLYYAQMGEQQPQPPQPSEEDIEVDDNEEEMHGHDDQADGGEEWQ